MGSGQGSSRGAPGASGLARATGCVALTLALLALTGCGSDATTPTTAAGDDASPAPSTSAFVPGDGDRSGLVDVGDGRQLYLECSGTGSPTVVLISGAGVAADNWGYVGDPTDASDPAKPAESAVYPQTATSTRVCAYDRPGTEQMEGAPGRSTDVPQPITAQGAAADLHAVLTAAEVPGPYVVVGHSWGGMIATVFARTYPDDVAGLVLVDPGSQYLQATLPPDVWEQWMTDIAAAGQANPGKEAPDYPSSIAALEALPPLPSMPTAVLSADRPFDYLGIGDAEAYWQQWLDAAALLAESLGATHVTETGSGHFVGNEHPELVMEQIRAAIIMSTRSG